MIVFRGNDNAMPEAVAAMRTWRTSKPPVGSSFSRVYVVRTELDAIGCAPDGQCYGLPEQGEAFYRVISGDGRWSEGVHMRPAQLVRDLARLANRKGFFVTCWEVVNSPVLIFTGD